jgi:hypothetical protein
MTGELSTSLLMNLCGLQSFTLSFGSLLLFTQLWALWLLWWCGYTQGTLSTDFCTRRDNLLLPVMTWVRGLPWTCMWPSHLWLFLHSTQSSFSSKLLDSTSGNKLMLITLNFKQVLTVDLLSQVMIKSFLSKICLLLKKLVFSLMKKIFGTESSLSASPIFDLPHFVYVGRQVPDSNWSFKQSEID